MLNHEKIKKVLQRITKIKPFVNKYDWKEVDFSSEKDHWKIFDKNNATIALNVWYVKKEKMHLIYVSKNNSNYENQVNYLMIPNREGWHYLAVKNFQHY